MVSELKIVLRPLLAGLSAAVVIGTLAGLSSVSLMGLSAWLIASAALQPPLYVLSLAIVGVRFCGIMRALLRYLERYLSHKVAFALFTDLRTAVLRKIIAALPFKRQTSNGDAYTIIVEAVDKIRDDFLRFFLPPFTATFSCFAVMIWANFYNVVLVYVLSAAWLVFIIIMPLAVRYFYQDCRYRQSSLPQEILEFYEGGRELFAYNFSGKKLKEAKQAIDIYQQQRNKRFRLKCRIELICEVLLGLFMVVILQTVICLTWENEINAVMAIAFLLTMQSVLEILATVPALVEYLDEAGRSLMELKLFMKEPQDRQQKEFVPDKNTQAVLELKNISYGYKEPLCRNMSFSLYKGRRVLLVGSSGTGKSTLFYLLMRLIEPICGNMYLNGKDYTAWDKQKWRLYFAASFQEHYIFNLSIKDNFKMFYPDITDEEIWRALRAVQLEKFGQKYGLDYVLAAGGINLSGGQKHRMQLAISLARKKDIILLDEPTAGLDIVSAHEFLKQLMAADKEAAMLVASHDLSIADYFDDVIIMGEQKIIEQGDIKMLMQNENSHLHKMMKYNNLI